ncbi:EamA family transporter [Saccharomonospora piscinae]|uniref:EamA family transporter n=1 Tax=Saccharomonospora piscinae TaxID=687388 RepID=A0A1V9AA98_SACPI|nr:EamA family transporter [Saccharomonospora piscinae]OQO94001.1 EamA family transporter [Saccharomonospora piscinae]TLW95173.1 EamA family transporter [Saccharomonospora piscinae]
MTISRPTRALDAVPAPAVFVLSGISLYVGAAFAVWLFDVASPAGVAWLRCLGAALILLAWRRPGRAAWRGRPLLLAATFGVVTAGMNVLFYEAIARLPLGTAVAIEFVGPILVAALGSRGVRDLAALACVVTGVLLIADVQWEGSPAGLAFALGAALAWAGYIVLGTRVARAGNGIDSLAVGFAVATVVLSPLALGTTAVWGDAGLLAFAVGVGLLSTVVPYALDQVVLRRVRRSRFALLLALLPVTAAVVGFVVLRQVPTLGEALGILAVVVGVALRSGTRSG